MTKLATNTAIQGLKQKASEALNLAAAGGIGLPLAYDALEASAACEHMFAYRRDQYQEKDSQNVSFAVALIEKDIRSVIYPQKKFGVQVLPATLTCYDLQKTSHSGFDARHIASIIDYLHEESL
ncbi:MAG: NAD-binding protein [Paracoccaceae bacterium]|nr:NAD-binding protein [Paracoccaceae bacterium]